MRKRKWNISGCTVANDVKFSGISYDMKTNWTVGLDFLNSGFNFFVSFEKGLLKLIYAVVITK